MALWGKADDANSVPLIVLSQLNKAPNSTNRTALFGNTTGNSFVTYTTKATVGIDANEIAALNGAPAHTGMHLKTVGQGGRAGRTHYECLVAGGVSTDASDDTILPDAAIFLSVQPLANSSVANAAVTFRVAARVAPVGVTLNYVWQEAQTPNTTFANVTNAGVYSGATSNTLVISNPNGFDTYVYRVLLTATGAVNVTSSNATLTVT